jgi:hypothetical protein
VDQFDMARHYLDCGAPAAAAYLFEQLAEKDQATPERMYYWALAILSGRSWEHIDPAEFARLCQVFERARPCARDDWYMPLEVLAELVTAWLRSAADGDPTAFRQASVRISWLPRQRIDEFRRHLARMLGDPVPAAPVPVPDPDRARRVPCLFEPEPRPPALPDLPGPAYQRSDVAAKWGNAAVACLGLVLLLVAAGKGGLPETVCGVGVCAGCVYLRTRAIPLAARMLALVGFAFSFLIVLLTAVRGEPAFVAGALLTVPFGCWAVLLRRMIRRERAKDTEAGLAAARRFEQDGRAYAQARARAARRPKECELAAWLYADLRLIRAAAVRACDATVLGAEVVAVPAEGSGAAGRFHSCYAVTVVIFMPTSLRVVRTVLDMASGPVGGEYRQSLRYGGIVSVWTQPGLVEATIAGGRVVPVQRHLECVIPGVVEDLGELRTVDAAMTEGPAWFGGAPARAKGRLTAYRRCLGP